MHYGSTLSDYYVSLCYCSCFGILSSVVSGFVVAVVVVPCLASNTGVCDMNGHRNHMDVQGHEL